MSKVLVAVISNIEKTQAELIGCMVTQICENVDDVSVIDFYKDFKLSKTVYGEYNLFKVNQWDYDNWYDMYKNYKECIQEFDSVILIKTPTLRGTFTRMLDEEFLSELDKGFTKDNKFQMSQDIMRRLIERLVFVKACRDKKVYQFCIDTQEVDFSKVWKFKHFERRYIFNHGDMKYFPMYEWAMANTYIQEIDKIQSIYFNGSAFTEEKKKGLSVLKECVDKYLNRKVSGPVFGIMTGSVDWYDDEDKRDTRVPQSTYMYNLKLSKYTIINTPYDDTHFNMYRFMEAIICDCIPIILPYNNLEDLQLTFPDIYNIISLGDLVLMRIHADRKIPMEMAIYSRLNCDRYDRDKIRFNEIKNSKSFKKITDQEYVKGEFKKLLER